MSAGLPMKRGAAALLLALAAAAANAGVVVRQDGEQFEVEFRYREPRVGAVAVAGSFNHWSLSAAPMTRGADDTWSYVLRGVKPSDVLQYKFVTGTTQPGWVLDPDAPDTADDGKGGKNGQVVVRRFLRASAEEIPADLAREGAPLAARVPLVAVLAKPADGVKNLIGDAGFEAAGLDGWTVRGEAAAVAVQREPGNAHAGEHALKYTLDRPFAFLVMRRFSGLADGNYSLRAWAQGGGGEASLRLFARDCGGPVLSTPIVNSGWRKWVQYTVKGIQVKGGECTIGLYANAAAGAWGSVDDLEFFQDGTWTRLTVEPAR